MWIVRLALRRPFTVAAFCLVMLLLGVLSTASMAVDVFPAIDIPVVIVVWNYPGMSAEDMESRITFVSERGISTSVNGVSRIDSQTIDGTSVLRVYFEQGADIGSAIAQITSASLSASRVMPPGIQPPVVLQFNASNVPVAQLSIGGTANEQQLFDWGLNFLRVRLFTVPGLSTPAPYGGKQREIMVQADAARAQASGISPQDIVQAVLDQNVILPAGTARFGNTDYDVLINGSPPSADEFNRLPIKVVNGAMVYVGDVARVYDGYAEQTNVVRVDGRRATYLAILKKQNASTLAVIDTVKSQLPMLRSTAPQGVELKLDFDQSVFVRAAVWGVIREAIIAAVLVALMVLAFIGSWRSTLIVCFSIPLSIVVGICCLGLAGQTFNLMTLGGLSLVIGMLVDDATVEIENINRNRGEGKEMLVAILDGARQVALPALAATLSICIVFFPVILLTGPAKYLFFPLALAVVFSMLASYLLSRTLVPTLASMLLPHEKPEKEREEEQKKDPNKGFWTRADLLRRSAFEKLLGAYDALLTASMAMRVWILVLGALFVTASGFLFTEVGLDFFPSVDAGLLRFHYRAPKGTRIEETERLVDAVEGRVRTIIGSDLDAINDNIGVPLFYNLGFVPSENASDEDVEVTIGLKPKHHDPTAYKDRIRSEIARDFVGSTLYFEQADVVSQVLNFGMPSQIDVEVQSREVEKAIPLALRLQNELSMIPGAVDVRLGQVLDRPAMKLQMNRERAIELGLDAQNVASSVLTSLTSSTLTNPNFWVDPKNRVNYSVVVQTPYYHVGDVPTLMETPITSGLQASAGGAGQATGLSTSAGPTTGAAGAPGVAAYLGQLATLQPTTTRASIRHETLQPTLDVECAVEGRDLGSVASEVDAAVKRLGKLPPGVTVHVAGQSETMFRAFGRLGLGMLLAVALVYLLLVVLFQSWLDPLLILLAVPASLSGVLWMLTITGTTLNVESLMGAIMAIGIAASNSILLVHFANERRMEDEKLSPEEAALFAGRTRFRPVLMTATAMILGMLPMAIGLGEAGQQNAPLGRAVIGGLLVSTFATLIVIPCAYAAFRKRAPVMGKHDKAVAEADKAHGKTEKPGGEPAGASQPEPQPQGAG
ncbi:MAG TPA: efflux RND transporter permease subunit [Polyangiaceae bacterium]|nr:efflux RND transporter permease subunit [Polyangiaceae bacterium]